MLFIKKILNLDYKNNKINPIFILKIRKKILLNNIIFVLIINYKFKL